MAESNYEIRGGTTWFGGAGQGRFNGRGYETGSLGGSRSRVKTVSVNRGLEIRTILPGGGGIEEI